MNDNELLMRHAEKWASDKNRAFDRDLVETALNLRDNHDGLAANKWPTGSVQHLMLSRWPSHGPVGVPDVPALVDSLETYWRFLRTTGRMGGGSAEPASLIKESKQAAKKMAAACADQRNHGPAKSMLSFGSEIGIDFDDVPDLETMQARLAEVQAAWNALPTEERRRRSPGLEGPPPPGAATHWHSDDDPQSAFDDEYATELSNPADSAPHFRNSPYVAALRALLDWVGEGRPVTSTGVLKPAVAREAYEALDLWQWDSAWQRIGRTTIDTTNPEVDAALKDAALNS